MAENLLDVLIVGAGAAGLTAAYDLHHGTDYTFKVLEANTGIGGRLQKLENFTDFPIDLGEEWIHVKPKILNEIADLSPTDDIATVQYVDTYEGWTGSSWYTIDYGAKDYKFVNYTWADFFHDKVASDVMEDVVLDCQVSTIDWTDSPVAVTCKDGRQWTAKHVVVTASMKVLQDDDIHFSPQLPSATRDAIHEFTFLNGMKVFLKFEKDSFRFKEAFQIDSDVSSGPQTPHSGERFFYDITYGQQSEDNVLGIFAVGDPVVKFLNMTDDEIYAHILTQLDGVYNGQATPNFLEGFVQNWNHQEFVKGAYTSLADDWDALGAILTLRESLDDRIFFSGEGVPIDWDYGYAHGAALSGRSAAARIKALLDGGSNNDDDTVDDDGQNDDDTGNDDGSWDDDWEGDDDWFWWRP